ncbi:MAG: alkaline phosphatase PhoX, partial [Pseudomonadota bacterium]
DGHIINTVDDNDGLGTTFKWEIYLLASSTRGTEGVFTDPDAAYADPFGRLFIGTDGGQPDDLQDQLTVFDTTTGDPEPKRLLVGVLNDEVTGWATTPDYKTAFTNLQHPGDGNPDLTNFPKHFDGVTIPRDATLVITRKNGGVVGS